MSTKHTPRFTGVFIPARIWESKAINWKEKCFLAQVDALQNSNNWCWAENAYFAALFETSEGTISNMISTLKKEGFLKIKMEGGTRLMQACFTPETEAVDDHQLVRRDHQLVNETGSAYIQESKKKEKGELVLKGDQNPETEPQRIPPPKSPPKVARKGAPPTFVIPLLLNTPEFIQVWNEWLKHLGEKKKKLGETAGTKQLKKLEKMGVDQAIQTIEYCIERNWSGIFEMPQPVNRVNGHKALSPVQEAFRIKELKEKVRELQEDYKYADDKNRPAILKKLKDLQSQLPQE